MNHGGGGTPSSVLFYYGKSMYTYSFASRLVVASLFLLISALAVGCRGDGNLVSPIESPFAIEDALQFDCSPSTASYGAVAGILYLTNYHPAVGSILYLGECVGLETGNPVVVVDPGKHPQTRTGEGGMFCFHEVPPGNYGLVVWNAVESVLLADPATGHSLLIEVRGGNTTNVGKVFSPIP